MKIVSAQSNSWPWRASMTALAVVAGVARGMRVTIWAEALSCGRIRSVARWAGMGLLTSEIAPVGTRESSIVFLRGSTRLMA